MSKVGRNAPCPCGSGKKYKRCCEESDLMASFEKIDEEYPELTPTPAQERIFDCVYESILIGVWFAFHPPGTPRPDSDTLDEFYKQIYGDNLDPFLVEEIVYPLSPAAEARLASLLTKDGVIDIDGNDVGENPK